RRLEQSAKEGGPKFRFAAVSADTKEETINSVLNRFAPIGRRVKNPNPAQELDVLISTDMLSEGVNLQDADLLINFDLPWNPMRIVQRVGRVNRIGSDNVVRVLNFVPDEVLEQFLNLVQILSSKIAQVTALLGKEMAILSSDDEEIEARDIGESIRKVQASKSVSDIELLARKSTLFSAFEGETPEDFFRMELFVASKRAHVRPSDFLNAPADDGKTHYYCAVSSEPKAAYRLYEIYGKRDHQHDRLARFWLCAGTTGAATASDNHPTEFLRVDPAKEGGFNAADFKNADAVRKMEEEINKAFEQRVEERRDMNSPRNLARRAQQIGGRQKTLATQIDTLIKQGGMGDSFVETAAKQRPDAERLMGDLLNVMESHELAARHLSQLARALADKSIDPSRSEVSPAQFRDLAGVLFDFYDSVVLKDAALRGHLYTRSEIDGRAVATIYL
ncbi:MAG: type III restriction endonuclease subunit R, partial [Spirochaetia bacterium]|nr:type III restriction endonuclease subunit R [Spirochaetia bacterium]